MFALADGTLLMQFRPEFIWIGVLVLLALAIVVANDFHKQSLVKNARRTGRKVKKDWLVNKTDWFKVGLIVAAFALFVTLLILPHWVPRNLPGPLRPLEPLVDWLFDDPQANDREVN